MKELTEQDFERAAKRLRCEKAAIKAVANTESAGKGFYADGFPVILFERHLFRKFTQGRYNTQFPELSGPAGNYGAAGANQRRKFNMAFALNPDAAMKSCSWGKFQILGSNHKVCGYDTVGEFVDAIKESEGKHLDAFVSFVIGNHLDGHLRSKNWAAFASGYNGKGYRKNNYDVKMAKAYVRFSATSTKPASDSEPQTTSDVSPDPSESLPIETTTVETSDGSSAVVEQTADTIINEESLIDKATKLGDKYQAFKGVLDNFGFSIENAKRSLGTILLTSFKAITGVIMAVGGVMFNNWELFVIAGLLIILAFLLWERSGKRVADAKAGIPTDVAKAMIEKM